MRVFKALRRSIKGDKDKQPQISIAPKSAVAIVPPKKVSYELRQPPRLGRRLFMPWVGLILHVF